MTDLEARVAKLEQVVGEWSYAFRLLLEYGLQPGKAVGGKFELDEFADTEPAVDVDRPNTMEG